MDTIIIDGMAFALPLFIAAIGAIYCERSGIVNLAIEGFMGVGAFCGALAVVLTNNIFPAGGLISFIIALISAVAGATLFSLIHALLCIKFKANQTISGVVMNLLALAMTTFLTRQINAAVFGMPSSKLELGITLKFNIPILCDIPIIGAFFKEVYIFNIVIIIVAILMWYVLYHRKFGVHLRACGDNPHAVAACGIEVSKTRVWAIMVSGALSGIAGLAFAYSIYATFSSNFYVGYGYLSIAAMIFGNWKIVPTLFACLIFGFARSFGYSLSGLLGLASTFSDLTMTLPYILTLLLLVFFSKNNQMPKALGEVYDKSKR
ncbi:MAG: ABC transporter permease [Candidatus Epulonipiscioides saccharophilum]|nr:MAG: ABC transporter permease [Epulopiscium sp. AS2M-Bin001]